jgi:hypothetical protein
LPPIRQQDRGPIVQGSSASESVIDTTKVGESGHYFFLSYKFNSDIPFNDRKWLENMPTHTIYGHGMKGLLKDKLSCHVLKIMMKVKEHLSLSFFLMCTSMCMVLHDGQEHLS